MSLPNDLRRAMMVAVVLDGKHHVFPAHIEVIAGVAEVVENRDLGFAAAG